MQQKCEITREWLDRMIGQAASQSSDADVILDMKMSIDAMQMQGALSEEVTERLGARLIGIAARLVAAGDPVDEGLRVTLEDHTSEGNPSTDPPLPSSPS